MADAGSDAVHTGFWLDHDRRGRVQGATLTLTNRKAAALLAFLAIVVTFAANRSFKICRFCLHHYIHPSDAGMDSVASSKRGQQVILRNSETAGGALVSLLETAVSEKSSSPAFARVTSKSMLLKLFITGHWLVFIALGVLTSQIVIGRTVVSKKTGTCGKWALKESQPQNDSAVSSDEWTRWLNEFGYNGTLDADNYVHNCYNDKSARGFFDCSKFVSRSLSFSEEHNVSCPFERGFCMAGENSAFSMDSGNISFSALGINKKHSKDLSVRRRTTCAVVDQNPFYIGMVAREDESAPGGFHTVFNYSFNTDESGENVTLSFRNDTLSSTYDLLEFSFLGESSYAASRVLQPNNSTNDVSIMFLRGPGVKFFDVQDDPWFTAHRKLAYDNSTGDIPSDLTRYVMDHFLNVLVCDERSQFCNQMTGECNQWHGLILDLNELNSTHGNLISDKSIDGYADMLASIVVVLTNIQQSYLTNSIQGRGHAALQAIRYFNYGDQYRLNPEQWKVELRYWFQMALARVQIEIFNTIERPIDVDPERTQNIWAKDVTSALCGNIKFRSANYTSLSTTGIIVILLGATILTMISFLDQLLASRFLVDRFQKLISAWEETENLALLKQTSVEVSMKNLISAVSTRVVHSLTKAQSWNSNIVKDNSDDKVQVMIREEQTGLIDNV